MANENGIVIDVSPSLGLSRAGEMWLPLPDSGMPSDSLSLSDGYRTIAQLLCTRWTFESGRDYWSLSVTSTDWAGVERRISELRLEAAAKAAEIAAATAKESKLLALVDAAIADPNPSMLLTRADTDPCSPWDWHQHPDYGWSAVANDRLRSEGSRRNGAARDSWNESLRALPDGEFLRACGGHPRESCVDEENKTRLRDVRSATREAENKAKSDAICAAFAKAWAPSHVTERYLAGVLPDHERDTWLNNAAFSTILLPTFTPLTVDDCPDHSDECRDPEVKFSGAEYDGELDSDEWESWKLVKSTLELAGFQPQLRISRVYCNDDRCDAHAYSLHARVETVIGGITVRREYAVDA
jgi:hypothetical protein